MDSSFEVEMSVAEKIQLMSLSDNKQNDELILTAFKNGKLRSLSDWHLETAVRSHFYGC